MKKIRFTVKGKARYDGIALVPDEITNRAEQIEYVKEHLPAITLDMVEWAGSDKDTVELWNEADIKEV